MIKRAVDVVVALLALTVSGPLWLIAAVLIKLESPGPVFFTQRRIGRNFRPFFIYKFRTMVAAVFCDVPSWMNCLNC